MSFLRTALFSLLLLAFTTNTKAQLNLTSAQTQLSCGIDTITVTATPSQPFTGPVTYVWYYTLWNPVNAIPEFFSDTTTLPEFTLITGGQLDLISAVGLDSAGYLETGQLFFNNPVQASLQVFPQNAFCDSACDKTYQVFIYNNIEDGILSIGNQNIPIPVNTGSVLVNNVCPGDSFTFTSVSGCVSEPAVAGPGVNNTSTQLLFVQDGIPGSCSSIAFVKSNACELPLSAVILTLDGQPYSGQAAIFITNDTIKFSGLCQGYYTYQVLYPSGNSTGADFYVNDSGINTIIANNLQTTDVNNYNCTGSATVDILSTIAPFNLYLMDNSGNIFDSIAVSTNNYTYNVSNLCAGYYNLFAGITVNALQIVTYISINNQITYNFSVSELPASSCYLQNGSITLSHDSLPSGFTAQIYNYGLYTETINLNDSGTVVLDSLAEGSYLLSVFDAQYQLYYSQFVTIGLVQAGFDAVNQVSVLSASGCGKCFGEAIIELDSAIQSTPYLYFYSDYSWIDENTIRINGLCEGESFFVIGAEGNPSACIDTVMFTVDTLLANSNLQATINNIVPASCNTYDSMDGMIDMNASGSNAEYRWFYQGFSFFPISDSLDLFNVSSGQYELCSYDTQFCNLQTIQVPFTDSCSTFTFYTNRDFNQNCQFDEFNYIQRPLIINPGSQIVNSYSSFSIPLGNYTVSPASNASGYCDSVISIVSDGNDYSYAYQNFFSDSSVYNDVEMVSFGAYSADIFPGFWSALITNNSNTTVNTSLQVNFPLMMDSITAFTSYDTLWQVPLQQSFGSDNININLTLEPLRQQYIYCYLYRAGQADTSSFTGTVFASINYQDIDSSNNQSITNFFHYDDSGWRSSIPTGLMVRSNLSRGNGTATAEESLAYQFGLMNNSEETISHFILEIELNEKLDLQKILFNRNAGMQYSIKNQTLTIKSSQLNLEPGKSMNIDCIVPQISGNQAGDIISSNARYSYRHLAFRSTEMPPVVITGTKQNTSVPKELKVYPNPADEMLNILTPDGTSFLQLTDLSGRIVKEFSGNVQNLQIDISELSPGTYLLSSHGSLGRTTTRFTKK